MRNISFMLTTDQVRRRTKWVTRRLGWWKLVPGELLCGVERGMGLKAGESVIRLAVIRVVSVRAEPLRRMIDDPAYGVEECRLEGFGDHPDLRDPANFIDFFCRSHKTCTRATNVNRIAFEYVDSLDEAIVSEPHAPPALLGKVART
jgi:hypothetical protein